jgi:hypothetical protein
MTDDDAFPSSVQCVFKCGGDLTLRGLLALTAWRQSKGELETTSHTFRARQRRLGGVVRCGEPLLGVVAFRACHPLSEVCPALTASTTMRMAWITTGALSIMMLCPEWMPSRCLLWADFVAEVRCKLFWSVIPSL